MSRSYREINKDLVLEACERYISRRTERIRAEQEPFIQQEMRPKLFGLIKGKTREQAIEDLEEHHLHDYNLAKIRGGSDAYRVKELRNLCQLSGDNTVKLTAEDANILVDYFPK